MALWKPFLGTRTALDTVEKHPGYVYWCADDGSLHFDYTDADGNLQRKQINAKDAETLCGMSLDELKAQISTQDTVILRETQAYTDTAIATVKTDISNQGVVILAESQTYTNVEVAKDRERLATLEAIDHEAYVAADTALKTELQGKITAEENRAKGVEESLQTQINTIMNNPDTEGVINSINEFTQYIEEHGEIAEGFRKDIDANTRAIESAKIEAANQDAVVLSESQTYTDQAIEAIKTDIANQDAVVLHEAQAYADSLASNYATVEQVTALINDAISNLPKYNGEVEEI